MPIGPDNIRGFGIPNPPNPNPAPVPPPVPPVGPGQPGQPRTATIYERARQAFVIVANGSASNTEFAFPIRTIYVQNFTNQYLWIEEAQRFLIPWEIGAVIPGNAMKSLTVRWITPVGISQPANPQGDAYIKVFEQGLVLVPGQLVPPAYQ